MCFLPIFFWYVFTSLYDFFNFYLCTSFRIEVIPFLLCLSLSSSFLFFQIILLLFNYSRLHLPPTTAPYNPSHPHLHPLLPPLLGFVHVSFIVVPENLSPFPPLSPPTSPLVTVRLFLISMSLVILCLFVCFVD